LYTKNVPFKDLNGNPRNHTVHFKLFERDVFRLMGELKAVFDWTESMKGEMRELETTEVVDFYTNFEEILLNAYGVPSADGLKFDRSGRYDFEQSVVFNAVMVMMVTDPAEVTKLLDGIMPDGMEDLVKKADEALVKAAAEAADSKDENHAAEIERLRAQLAAAQAQQQTA
jgi:hypothetical protein